MQVHRTHHYTFMDIGKKSACLFPSTFLKVQDDTNCHNAGSDCMNTQDTVQKHNFAMKASQYATLYLRLVLKMTPVASTPIL